jgi:hypothetical protein
MHSEKAIIIAKRRENEELTWSGDEVEDDGDEDVRLLVEQTLSPLLLPVSTFFPCSLSVLCLSVLFSM